MDYVLRSGPVSKDRYTIGYLDNNQQNDFHNQLLVGVAEASKEFSVDIIRFGYYSSHIAYKFSHQVAMVLDHIQQYDLDGLLFLGWTRAGAMYNYDDFVNRFRDTPLLSLGTIYADIPSVYFSGDQFVSKTVKHLIEVHGRSKIAYIEHHRPDNRKDFYDRTLQEYGIFDPNLYVEAEALKDLNQADRNQRAIEILLDERQLEIDAIVTLNIIEAGYVIDALEKRGLKVPDDVAVTGYEDSDVGLYSAPGRTTIYFPWREMGYWGCKSMIRLLREGRLPMTTKLDDLGRIAYRESCGCLPFSIQAAAAETCRREKRGILTLTTKDQAAIVSALKQEYTAIEIQFDQLLTAFLTACRLRQKETFLKALDQQLRQVSHRVSIRNLITDFRKKLMPFLQHDQERLVWAGDLFLQSQVLIYERAVGLHGNRYLQERIIDQNLQIVNQTLLLDFGLQNLSDSLTAGLSQLNIKSCSIFVSESILTGAKVDDLFERSVEVFRYHDGKVFTPNHAPQNLRQMLQEQRQQIHDPVSLAYLLHVTDEVMGFALFGAGTLDEVVYQQLSTHISTALQGIVLLNRLNITYKQLVDNAHRQGMADIATDILHNIGNILNSINVSLHLMEDQAKAPLVNDVRRAGRLLDENLKQLENFIRVDPRGKKLMQFYLQLDKAAQSLQERLEHNLKRVQTKVEDIGQTVSAQQNYAGIDTAVKRHPIAPILEDVLKLHTEAFSRYQVKVEKKYQQRFLARVHRGKLFFVLFSLIDQAIDALKEIDSEPRRLQIELRTDRDGRELILSDNGKGLSQKTLDDLFEYDASALKGGRQFSLYSCASYMADMGAAIEARSDGPGKGTAFILKFQTEEDET